jgi:hypothetical protein
MVRKWLESLISHILMSLQFLNLLIFIIICYLYITLLFVNKLFKYYFSVNYSDLMMIYYKDVSTTHLYTINLQYL